MIIYQKKIIKSFIFISYKINNFIVYFSWDIDINEDETLTIKYPRISTIDWDLLTRVDNQMEEALQQCKQDFIQYQLFFQNLIKEVYIQKTIFYFLFIFSIYVLDSSLTI